MKLKIMGKRMYKIKFKIWKKKILLTTKITAIAVVNYYLVEVQFSYFVYENT